MFKELDSHLTITLYLSCYRDESFERLSTGLLVLVSTSTSRNRALCPARRYPTPRDRARDIRAYLPTRISQRRNNIPVRRARHRH